MNFSQVKSTRIPEGTSIRIRSNGKVIWSPATMWYVSLGDSIAAGHSIDDNWKTSYGEQSQYGVNGNAYTTIVPGSYTDLIRNEMVSRHGKNNVRVKSFARSGDTVAKLMEKLTHSNVVDTVEKADLITVCIGANDVMEPAMSRLDLYINTGDFSEIDDDVNNNLENLKTDSNPASYRRLFEKLTELNPYAKIVFTTVYNPYKYLWIEDGHYGFFEPLLNLVPDMEILGMAFDSFIKDSLLGTPAVQTLFNRVNGLSAWAEKNVTRLNQILRDKIDEYRSVNPNIMLADSKTLYDTFPDRPINAQKHYNDLVNVEYTRDYNTATMDWGRMWPGSNSAAYWTNMVSKHGLNIDPIATDFAADMIEKVIVPDVDPHPETYGQYVLSRAFLDVLDYRALDRHTIAFNANGGSGSMASQVVVGVDGLPAFVNINAHTFTPAEGYYLAGWNTVADGSGTAYSAGQYVGISSDFELHAQWSNIYAVTYRHSMSSNNPLHTQEDTGPMECYEFWIDGTKQEKLGAFSNPPVVYYLPYGTPIGAIVSVKSGNDRSYVELNGKKVHEGTFSKDMYTHYVTGDTDVHFEWNFWFSLPDQSYWNCYITTK